VTHYLHGTGEFETLRVRCERAKASAELKKSVPNPLSVYDDYSFSGQPPTPFILLARRILTVTANSASCERLFSTFGSTLTKLRNRLGTGTLQALAELKMHIRDQQIQKGTKEHLKRHFGEQHPQTNRNAATALVNVGAALPSFPLTPVSHHPARPVTITPQTQVTAVGQPSGSTGTPVSRPHTGTHVAAGQLTPQTTPPDSDQEPTTNFRVVVDAHISLGLKDDIDTAPCIQELFDFRNGHWSEIYSRVAKRSFDEELDLYDLLDADADGEEDFEIELDGAMEEVLCT
ncbi:hypothetical protein PAXINDRAFT_158655, partial [Paxillus involutus ATCC 200175]